MTRAWVAIVALSLAIACRTRTPRDSTIAQLSVELGGPARASLGHLADGAALPEDVRVAPASLTLKLPGVTLRTVAHHVVVRQQQDRITSVLVFPIDQTADFQTSVASLRALSDALGLASSPRAAKGFARWAKLRPELDAFSRHIITDCLPGKIAVDFAIRPTVSLKTWSTQLDIGLDDDCERIRYPRGRDLPAP